MNEQTHTATRSRRPPTARRWVLALGGLAIAFAPMWMPRVRDATGLEIGAQGPASSIGWNILVVVILLTYVLGVERRTLNSIRIVRPTGKDLEWALVLVGAHMGWTWIAMELWPPEMNSGTATIIAMPVLVVLALIVSVAVCEEILYRGYPLERLTELTGHRWVAVALTLPLFVVPHLVFFGPEWLLYQGSGTLAIYVLYLWRRNLVACMVLHLAVNLPILIPTIAQRLD